MLLPQDSGWEKGLFVQNLPSAEGLPGCAYDSVELTCAKRKDLKQNSNIQTELCVCVCVYICVYGGGSSEDLTQLSHTAHQVCGREAADPQENGHNMEMF